MNYLNVCSNLNISMEVPSSFNSSAVSWLYPPPNNMIPMGEVQEVWVLLIWTRLWEVFHLQEPLVKVTQVLWTWSVSIPPHTVSPFCVWYLLDSDSWGREHEDIWDPSSFKTSTDWLTLGCGSPPVITIPGKVNWKLKFNDYHAKQKKSYQFPLKQ